MAEIDKEFWAFVDKNANADPNTLRLKYHNDTAMGIDMSLAIDQIECRKRYAKKLAETLRCFPHWLFPSILSGEQATSDRLAQYHTTLIDDGQRVIDLTTGLGIDAWHLSTKAQCVECVEFDPKKAEALKLNTTTYGLSNMNVTEADCRQYLKNLSDDSHDTLFIDPARRAKDGSRVFALSDCEPDVTSMLEDMKRVAHTLIVKASPMLDISQTLRELPGTKRIIALGTPTECKELIAIVDLSGATYDTAISAVTIDSDGDIFDFTYSLSELDRPWSVECGIPKEGDILYEPYPTVMKTAPFKMLCEKYGIKKLHNNTHLYFSSQAIEDFPGEKLHIERIFAFSSKNIKSIKKLYPRINVATRNFQMPADKLRTKLGVKDGGNKRLIAVTADGGHEVMLIVR